MRQGDAVRITFWQRFFARHLDFHCITMAGALSGAGLMFMVLRESGSLDLTPSTTAQCVVLLLAGLIAGWLGGLLASFPIRYSLCSFREKLNGGPFEIGQRVRILTGIHRGYVGEIYEVWDYRGQVRIDLGPELKGAVKNVFSTMNVASCV